MIRVQARAGNRAEIMIYDPIGQDWFGGGFTAKRFVEDLERLGDVKDITVRINSPGGEVWDGFAIYNALKNHPAQIHVQIDGLAASIASVIAMSGDLVTMGEGAMLMIHDPWSLAMGDSEDMRAVADMLDKVKVGIIDAYHARTGLEHDALAQMMEKETWFTAAEAIANGFADERESAAEPEPAPAAAAARWASVMAKFRAVPDQFQVPQATADSTLSASADASSQEGTMSGNAPASVQPTDNLDIARREAEAQALARETSRRTEIRNAFGKFADQHRPLLDECLDDPKCSIEAARAKLLAKLGEGAEPLNPRITPALDVREKFLQGAQNALMARSGLAQREAGNEFNGMTMAQLAGHSLSLSGVSVKGMSPDAIARKVLAAHSTSDFPNLLGNTAGKILREAYERFPSTWQQWCGVRSVSDFKQIKNIQMGSFDSLETIPEGGEYKFGSLTEESEPNQAVTKGKGLKLTRQMIVNDDLGGFNRRAQLLGAAAARTVNADAYGIINANAALSDSIALFHASHNNLAGSGGAVATATLSAAKAAMRKQKDAGSKEFLNIMPRYLLVPVAIEDLAREVITSTTKSGQTNSSQPNVLRNFVDVIGDPKLDEESATAWYLVADPAQAELVQVVFLDGQQTPFIDDDVEFMTDALLFKVRLDYGTAAVDFRAGYKNAGG